MFNYTGPGSEISINQDLTRIIEDPPESKQRVVQVLHKIQLNKRNECNIRKHQTLNHICYTTDSRICLLASSMQQFCTSVCRQQTGSHYEGQIDAAVKLTT